MGIEYKLKSNIPEAINFLNIESIKKMTEAVVYVRNLVVSETLTGNRSGVVYRIPGTSRFYQASAPGEPPAVRFGHLRQSVNFEVQTDAYKVIGIVGTPLDYGKKLEHGYTDKGKTVAPRPWLAPSFQKATAGIKRILGAEWR